MLGRLEEAENAARWLGGGRVKECQDIGRFVLLNSTVNKAVFFSLSLFFPAKTEQGPVNQSLGK